MKRSVITAILLISAAYSSIAQVQELAENRGASAVRGALLRLRTTVAVLHTTAHPDDEDAALLTWLARNQGVRTGLLTLNRGEGGANLIGPELYDALGILRTEELLAAGRYYGLDRQFFTRVSDFGFSKRLDETIEHWGEELTLGDQVRAIRMFRPDIIISRFHGKARDGHGNHQAAGLLSLEAYRAAADPNRFPEHFKDGLKPWKVRKLYLSLRENEPAATLKIDVGEYDPIAGRSYREISAEGYRMHRSQSVGQSRPSPGSSFSAVQLIEGATSGVQEKSLFDGIDASIKGLARLSPAIGAELAEIDKNVEGAISKFNAGEPWSIAPELAAGMRALRAAIEKAGKNADDHLLFLLRNKEREFNDAMNKALGLSMEALVDPEKPVEGPAAFFATRETFNVAIPGQQFTVTTSILNRSPVKVTPKSIRLDVPRDWEMPGAKFTDAKLENNVRFSERLRIVVPANAEFTRPYWSRENEIRDFVYRLDKPEMFGLPFPPPDVSSNFNYEVDGVPFTMNQPVQTVFVARPYGEQRRLLTIAPAINVGISPRVAAAPTGSRGTSFNVTVNLSNNVKGIASGKVRLKMPAGWSAIPAEQQFNFSTEGEKANFSFKVSVPDVSAGKDYKIEAVAEFAEREYVEGYQVIAQRDLEPRHLYRPATMEVRGIDVKIAPALTVGYVMGVGDEMPKAIEQLGVKVVMLNEQDLASGNLDPFDAIVVGIRATAVRNDLKAYNKRLLEYAERGGNLIYQYQTQEFDAAPYGPYPYKLTARAEEVSEEDAKVTILDPSHSIFNWPNKITPGDFDGWVEERGSKWMSSWDDRYQPLLECNDRGQSPQRGGMMFATLGKGSFTYAAYAFYRQLPAGVQGGYRLFANIISMKKRPNN